MSQCAAVMPFEEACKVGVCKSRVEGLGRKIRPWGGFAVKEDVSELTVIVECEGGAPGAEHEVIMFCGLITAAAEGNEAAGHPQMNFEMGGLFEGEEEALSVGAGSFQRSVLVPRVRLTSDL